MKFENKLISAKLIKRYKRFLCDVRLENDEVITVHCPNSGSMKTCIKENWKVMLSESSNPKRKLKHTLEMIHNEKCWIAVNTHLSNKIVKEAIEKNQIEELTNYKEIKTEVKYGRHNSRIDILLKQDKQNLKQDCYVEVKNVTLLGSDGNYQFPDAVTLRGRKHLEELIYMKENGYRAVVFFLIQRSDGNIFTPAVDIDPNFAETLKIAYNKGVEIIIYQTDISTKEIRIKNKISLSLNN